MSWIDHTLPSGQVVQQSTDRHGVVNFAVVGSDATIEALDAVELGKIAQAALGALSINPRCSKCGEFLTAIRVQMRLDRCAKCDGRRRGRRG